MDEATDDAIDVPDGVPEVAHENVNSFHGNMPSGGIKVSAANGGFDDIGSNGTES